MVGGLWGLMLVTAQNPIYGKPSPRIGLWLLKQLTRWKSLGAEHYITYARALEVKGNVTSAIRYYRKAIAAYPSDVDAYKSLVKLYISKGDRKQALKVISALELLSSNLPAKEQIELKTLKKTYKLS